MYCSMYYVCSVVCTMYILRNVLDIFLRRVLNMFHIVALVMLYGTYYVYSVVGTMYAL